MKARLVGSLVIGLMFGILQGAIAEETGIKIDFKQIHGSKPQSPLTLVDSEFTAALQKQLEKIFTEGGMLETSSFKQEPAANLSSALYSIDISAHGRIHHATIDEASAPPAYTKLIKFVLKHGVKPPQPLVEATTKSDAELPSEKH